MDLLSAVLLGLIEGLTEFVPVSSTGHLLLAERFLGLTGSATFDIVVQLGPILAIAWMYRAKLIHVFATARTDETSLRFIVSVLIAFLPAMVIGALAHDFIKRVLFETPGLIAAMLVLGGLVLLALDRFAPPEVIEDASDVPFRKAFAVGIVQCLAMVPGVSRSGATIAGARMLGFSRRAAAEFSFFLSLPTMLGAVSFDLLKSRHELDFSAFAGLAIGFVVATVSGGFVVRWMLSYVSSRGYSVFGWWRIIVGGLALALLFSGH